MSCRAATRPLALLLAPFCASALAAGIPTLATIEVVAGSQQLLGAADSASEGTVTAQQLGNRPLLRPAEVLEAIPGLTVTQHSGDGKANQYFLRGFNLDHGSDFSTTLLGMPVNMVSHAHGQGYMDLNFLIPELVASLRYRKGFYAAEDGDFGSTGAARIDYQRRLASPFAEVTLGAHGYRRTVAAASRDWNGSTWLAAVELAGNDGPWEQPEHLRKANAVLRLSSGTATNGFSLSALAYRSTWVATEHVPRRAIDSGEIGRFGNLLPNDGGVSHRHSLAADWATTDEDGAWQASGWVIDYGLNLFSGPSGFISGAAGDQHEQADRRTVWGGQLDRRWFVSGAWTQSEIDLGVQLRQDRIGTLGLYNTVDRQRTHTVREDSLRQTDSALHVEAKTQWLAWLRSSLGLRYDRIAANVRATGGVFNTGNGGQAAAHQASPKLGLVLGPFAHTEFYANWGHGFHSNDARGATSRTSAGDGSAIDPVPLIVQARGGEVGLRATPLPGWHTSATLWRVDLASELVFVGDEGVTEPRGSSRRHGLEWANSIRPWPGLIIDADLALSRARFRDPVHGGKHVPNAIPRTASLAATYDGGGTWSGGLRLRYLGAYDLEESGQEKSSGFWTANLKAGYRFDRQTQVNLDILNLFDRRANDIEYWGGACTRLEGPACNGGNGIDGRLIHPLEPRTFRLTLRHDFG